MTNFASSADVVAVWRPFTAEEAAIVDGVLTQASNKLRALVPTIDSLIDGNELKTALAKDAVVNAVIRRFQNPDGVLEFTIDDYRARRDSAVSTGKLYIDRADLIGLVSRRGRWGTINLKVGV